MADIISRLQNIADMAAAKAVNDFFFLYFQQAQGQAPSTGIVTNIASDGVTLTVQADDQTIQTATLINGQSVGIGSYVAISNGLAWGVGGS